MALLVSFVNQTFTPELKLGILEKGNKFSWILGDIEDLGSGMTGIAEMDNKLYCGVQKKGIAVLNENLDLIQLYQSDALIDPHSIISKDGYLLVISSGTNSILQLHLDKEGLISKENIFWTVPNTHSTYDQVHLNSLIAFENDIYASYFGERKQHQNWSDIHNGSIINTATNDVILRKLNHPHSLYNYNGLLICESRTGAIKDATGKVLYSTVGYLRGLTKHGRHYVVGVNSRRKLSKSRLGKLSGRINDFELEDQTECRIDYIKTKGFALEKSTVMTPYGNEIYELYSTKKFKPNLQSSNLSKHPTTQRIMRMEAQFVDFIKKGEKELNKIETTSEKRSKELVHKLKDELDSTRELLISKSLLDKKVDSILNMLNEVKIDESLKDIISRIDNNLQKSRAIQSNLNQIAHLEDKVSESQNKLIQISNQQVNIKAYESKIRDIEGKMFSQEKMITALQIENRNLNENFNNYKTLNDELSKEISKYETIIARSKVYGQRKEEILKANKIQLVELRKRIKAQTHEIDFKNKQITSYEIELATIKIKVEEYNSNIRDKEGIIKTQLQNIHSLSRTTSKLEKQLATYKEKSSALRNQLKRKSKEKEKEKNHFISKLMQIEEQLKSKQIFLERLERDKAMLLDKITISDREVEEKNTELLDYSDRISSQKEEIDELFNKLAKTTTQITLKNKVISSLKTQLHHNKMERKKTNDDYEKEIRSLYDVLDKVKRNKRTEITDIKASYTWRIGSIFVGIAKFLGFKNPSSKIDEIHN